MAGSYASMAVEHQFSDNRLPTSLMNRLSEQRRSGKFCDITISVEGGFQFKAHRNVLAAFSPYFDAMLSGSLAESRKDVVTLKEIAPESVRLLLDYAYTNRVVITPDNVQDLLSAADLLEITVIKEAACQYLANYMDVSNCIGIHCFGELHSCTQLQIKSKEYILQNFPEVSAQSEFTSLPKKKLIELISDDDLHVEKEEDLFEAVVRWCSAEPDLRECAFPEVFKHVRLGLIAPSFLAERVETLDLVRKDASSMALTAEAKLYHSFSKGCYIPENVTTKPRLLEVIVAVGYMESFGRKYSAIECFYPVERRWKTLTDFPSRIWGHGVAVGGKHTLYVAGGQLVSECRASPRAWSYDSVTNCWKELSEMRDARSGVGLAMLDGYLYAVGGADEYNWRTSVERYDPATNRWTTVAPIRKATINAAVTAQGGFLYVVGGSPIRRSPSRILQKYDPKKNEWTEAAPMIAARYDATICAVGSSHIYVLGGTDDHPFMECYDVHTNTWTPKSAPNELICSSGIAVLHGKIVACSDNGDSMEVYDPQKDLWTTINYDEITSHAYCGYATLLVRRSLFQEDKWK
ncbi:unnamed protein product [Nesidiocoris tenuis]|uniref:Kelch-like protein diablo n=1 Tax=Nesidiocoris tenuis TaxID=355587 RepID=A0A6H5GVX3_9HEMI|nr:unnamed protein product [Nesidiocoris tenuis]